MIHNQPSHGGMEADVELWVSEDTGDTWGLRSRITDHKPGTNRMNVAAGLNADGEMVVLCSGWNLDKLDRTVVESDVLAPQVLISSDGGHTWELVGEMPLPPDTNNCIPFGDVVVNGEELAVSCYAAWYEGGRLVRNSSFIARSHDGGRTWGDFSTIAEDNFNETDIIIGDDGRWLAACRSRYGPTDVHDPTIRSQPTLQLYTSDDYGRTWRKGAWLTRPSQHPAHLTGLAGGTILLTYGSRTEELYGVMGRLSPDGGRSWSSPFVIIGGLDNSDCGYPSDVQLDSGDIVTAYYAKSAPWCQRYHMGVVRWTPEMVGVEIG
ncbi:MAG: sialidase family protein [Armatimonadota bacterium]